MRPETSSYRKFVDLHIHTIFSDGTCTVKEVIDNAHERGLSAISITDHDCTDAYPEAIEIGNQLELRSLPVSNSQVKSMEPIFIYLGILSIRKTPRLFQNFRR
jgi:predicted metal-dependent phosphoesterase TrpH